MIVENCSIGVPSGLQVADLLTGQFPLHVSDTTLLLVSFILLFPDLHCLLL